VPVKINMNFIRSPKTRPYTQWGIIDYRGWFKERLNLNDLPYDPTAVNIFYLNNIGDAKVPLTGWILAHRMGHAFIGRNRFEDMRECYNNLEHTMVRLVQ